MYRGVDVRDVAQAHMLAMTTDLKTFEIFNVSAKPAFTKQDLVRLRTDTTNLIRERVPELLSYYTHRSWKIPAYIDRVYVIEKAIKMLGYTPKFKHRLSVDSILKLIMTFLLTLK